MIQSSLPLCRRAATLRNTMHVLFTRFPLESHFGGAEVQTLSLMKGLNERGHEVVFLGSCPVLLTECKKLEIGNWKLEIGAPPVTKWGAVSFLLRKQRMRKKIIDGISTCFDTRFDERGLMHRSQDRSASSTRSLSTAQHDAEKAVFMLSLPEKLLLTDWCVERGVKVFWIEHDRIGQWLTRNPWLPRLRRLSNLATIITVSDLSRDLYLKLGWKPERVVSIPNGIDIERFTCKKPTTYPLQPTTFHIGCLARLTHDKGVDLLIEAVAMLPNVALTIVGTGREEQHIHKLAEQVNENRKTNQRINVIPSVPNLPAFYHSLSVLVLPSREHDPFGLVVAEAMAAGIPVIVTDACGIARHLQKGEAIIIPAGSADAIRDAITTVQEKEVWQRLARNGPRIAQERFSLKRMVDVYEVHLTGTR